MEREGQQKRPGGAAAGVDRRGIRVEDEALPRREVPGVPEVYVGVVDGVSPRQEEEQRCPGRGGCERREEGAGRVPQRKAPSSSTILAAPR